MLDTLSPEVRDVIAHSQPFAPTELGGGVVAWHMTKSLYVAIEMSSDVGAVLYFPCCLDAPNTLHTVWTRDITPTMMQHAFENLLIWSI